MPPQSINLSYCKTHIHVEAPYLSGLAKAYLCGFFFFDVRKFETLNLSTFLNGCLLAKAFDVTRTILYADMLQGDHWHAPRWLIILVRIIFPFDAFFFFFLSYFFSWMLALWPSFFFVGFKVLEFYWELTFHLTLMMLLKNKIQTYG